MPNSEYYGRIADALIDVLREANSPEVREAQLVLLRRLALSGDVVPSRAPAPKNVTEVGGYLNLLEPLEEPALRAQVLASILGVAAPSPPLGWFSSTLPLSFRTHGNDRPGEAELQAPIPVTFSMRSDFLGPFVDALKTLHAHGCRLPLLALPPVLPQGNNMLELDMLKYIGRSIVLMPTTSLRDPDTDPIAVARLDSDPPGAEQVVARVIDDAASHAEAVPARRWTAWFLEDQGTKTYAEDTGTRRYLPIATIIGDAGWFQHGPIDTTRLYEPTSWNRFTNITGLIPGVTRYGDELHLIYEAGAIAASTVLDRVSWIWDGKAFVVSDL